jgi:hypothetical protein
LDKLTGQLGGFVRRDATRDAKRNSTFRKYAHKRVSHENTHLTFGEGSLTLNSFHHLGRINVNASTSPAPKESPRSFERGATSWFTGAS